MQQKFVLLLAQYFAEVQNASIALAASIKAARAAGYVEGLQHSGQLSMTEVDRELSLLSRVAEQRLHELGQH